jgi:NDP-sugar pyrophosphorylase family protein
MIRRIVRWLVAEDVTDLVVNLHHLPHTITAVLGDGRDLGARVRYSWEQPEVLGSAGGPRHALDIIGDPTFLIVNGDTLTDLRLAPLVARHRESGALVTMAVVHNAEPDRYGGVRLDVDNRVIGFASKGAAAVGSYHFVGVQIATADVFRSLPDGRPANSVGDVYDHLIAARPGSIRGWVSDAAFWDIGTLDDYERTSAAIAAAQKEQSPR